MAMASDEPRGRIIPLFLYPHATCSLEKVTGDWRKNTTKTPAIEEFGGYKNDVMGRKKEETGRRSGAM